MLAKHKKFINSLIKEASEAGMSPYAPEEIGFKYSDGYEPVAVDKSDYETEMDKKMAEDTVVDAILNQIKLNFQYLSDETLHQFVNIPQNPEYQTVDYILDVPARMITIHLVLDDFDVKNHTADTLGDFIKMFEKTLSKRLKSKVDVQSDVRTHNLGGPEVNKVETNIVVTITKADPDDVPNTNADEFLANHGRSTPRTKDDK